ncbi:MULTISPECIES: hypothetical protein [unclassified Nostoc]|nr:MULTISPECIES: hypothetical protein [unclassified Nostoc]
MTLTCSDRSHRFQNHRDRLNLSGYGKARSHKIIVLRLLLT